MKRREFLTRATAAWMGAPVAVSAAKAAPDAKPFCIGIVGVLGNSSGKTLVATSWSSFVFLAQYTAPFHPR